MLDSKKIREQSGRDTLSRYRAQIRSAAMACLSILEDGDVDRVYCDMHDDFVVRRNIDGGLSYVFYQVKTKKKKNENWKLHETFGLKSRIKDQSKQNSSAVKDSHIGKLLRHTAAFSDSCALVVFQTNAHSADEIDCLLNDIISGSFESDRAKYLVDSFNEHYNDVLDKNLLEEDVKANLQKLRFETDVQYLKLENDEFLPKARAEIYKYSEIDLSHIESEQILDKLLQLVLAKSSGVIEDVTHESIEHFAGISIEDMLRVLSISREAYQSLIDGGDPKAIRSASIIQRSLTSSGAVEDEIEYCSRCKGKWDGWLRKNRHVIEEGDLIVIRKLVKETIKQCGGEGGQINLVDLQDPINDLVNKLNTKSVLYDLSRDHILGAFFSVLVKEYS